MPQNYSNDVFSSYSSLDRPLALKLNNDLTQKGLKIRKDVQERLAAIRTDLDSFTDQEAYALMTSGYRKTRRSEP